MADKVDLIDRAFDWYLANPLATLKDVSEEFEISYETIRDLAARESWVSKRVMRGVVAEDQVVRQAEGIREVLYAAILSGPHADLPDLVKAWKSTIDIQQSKSEEETVDRDSLL